MLYHMSYASFISLLCPWQNIIYVYKCICVQFSCTHMHETMCFLANQGPTRCIIFIPSWIVRKETLKMVLWSSTWHLYGIFFLGPCRNVRLVSGARVPLVSFEDTQYNIACDVSIENDSAVLKSRLLRSIGEIDSRCRDLIFLVISYVWYSWLNVGYFCTC